MADDCPNCARNRAAASVIRSVADGILTPTAMLTGIPAPIVRGFVEGAATGAVAAGKAKGGKKKVSAYHREYKRAFKRVAPQYKTKGQKWRKNGFKRAVKEAHRLTGKRMGGRR